MDNMITPRHTNCPDCMEPPCVGDTAGPTENAKAACVVTANNSEIRNRLYPLARLASGSMLAHFYGHFTDLHGLPALSLCESSSNTITGTATRSGDVRLDLISTCLQNLPNSITC